MGFPKNGINFLVRSLFEVRERTEFMRVFEKTAKIILDDKQNLCGISKKTHKFFVERIICIIKNIMLQLVHRFLKN